MNKLRIKKYIEIEGGQECPKCKQVMQRRMHSMKPTKTWFYTKWDYCKPCGHIQHYEVFKSGEWLEAERQENMFKNI